MDIGVMTIAALEKLVSVRSQSLPDFSRTFHNIIQQFQKGPFRLDKLVEVFGPVDQVSIFLESRKDLVQSRVDEAQVGQKLILKVVGVDHEHQTLPQAFHLEVEEK